MTDLTMPEIKITIDKSKLAAEVDSVRARIGDGSATPEDKALVSADIMPELKTMLLASPNDPELTNLARIIRNRDQRVAEQNLLSRELAPAIVKAVRSYDIVEQDQVLEAKIAVLEAKIVLAQWQAEARQLLAGVGTKSMPAWKVNRIVRRMPKQNKRRMSTTKKRRIYFARRESTYVS